jgi:sugar lactone lactonase YvrE
LKSPIRDSIIPWRALAAATWGLCLFGTGNCLPPTAMADVPRYPDIMPLSHVKPGMVGYGLTTFHANTISRFDIKVIGIIKNQNVGHDLILIRMHGGPITERGANLIHGMSGSPIYIGGKIIGAFSQGEAFPKEPIGMVTPIEDMLDAWDPKIPQSPNYYQPADKPSAPSDKTSRAGDLFTRPGRTPRVANLSQPIQVGDRTITRLVYNVPLSDPRRSDAHLAVLHPATSLLTAGSLSERNRQWLQKELDRRGFAVTVMAGASGSGGAASFKAGPLRPGSCFGTFLATGDSPFGGYGTVTYRKGNRILGFGHPLMGLGPLEAAITSAYVVDVFSGVQTSHVIAIPGPVVGTLRQDRDFAVAGDLGQTPRLVPFDITVNDETSHRSQTFHSHVFQHPELTSALLSVIIRDCVGRVHDIPGDVMARVTTTVDAAEVGQVTRSNLYFDSSDVSGVVGQDMGEITNIISGNPFYPLPIKSAHMTVDIMPGHNTATVERIFLKQGRYEPGDTLEIGVVLKPYRREPMIKTVSIKIPSDTTTGRYQLSVRGGIVPQFRLGGVLLGGGAQDGPQSPPANVRQMVSRLNEHETNTDIVARLVLNSVAPSLEGEKLSQLPPNLAALMRSDRNSGVRLEREEVRTLQPAGYVTSGVQQLVVTIVRKNSLEPSGTSGPSTIPAGGTSGPPSLNLPGGGGTQLSNPNDDADASDPESLPTNIYERLFADPLFHPWMAAVSGVAQDKNGSKAPPPTQTKPGPDTTKPPGAAPAAAPSGAPPGARPAIAPDTSNDKPVGRQMQVWRQSARTDFSAGKFTSTSVAANGVLRLAPTLQRLASTTETYIWSLVADDQGTLYAGTGTSGKILKITADGKQSVLTTLPIIAVQSLVYSPKDRVLYAGSGVKGNIYKVSLDGAYRLVTKLTEKYVLALIVDDKGNLYVGAGGGGTVYRIPEDKLAAITTSTQPVEGQAIDHMEPFARTAASHIMALTLDHQNNLYVGTGNDGIIYKVTPDGKTNVLFDAKENSITGLATDKQGVVYAVTGPKGILYRISPDGGATTLFDRSTTFYTGLKAAPDGSLYATTVNAVFHFVPSATDPNQPAVVPLDNPTDIDFLSLVVLPDGSVAAGTGNVGEVYGVGPRWNAKYSTDDKRTGQFVSLVHDAKLASQWGMARWEANVPNDSSIRLETRTGNVAEPDSTWSDWASVHRTNKNEGTVNSPPARFIQYRIQLEATHDAQPSVREVSIDYLPHNQAPKVAFQSPAGGERWAKSQTVRWTANDPDNDTLTYELFYSDTGGASWKPLPTQPRAGASAATSGTGTPSTQPTFDEYQKQVNEQNLPDPLKQALLDRFKQRLASGGAGAAIRDTSKTWDTSNLPDGVYMLKVVASDHISNPTDPQTAQATSEAFVIINTAPRIALTGQPKIGADKTVTIQGVASQALVAVTAVQVRVDGGDWLAAAPQDGLFDGPREPFIFVTSSLSTGKHTIEVEAFNAAGQKSTEKTDVLIP